MSVEILSWDYRERPDLEALARIVLEKSGGRVHLTSVEDTGSQDYALVVSGEPLDQEAATAAYRQWWENGQRARTRAVSWPR